MALFLLLNSVGYTVYAHYCDDELQEASLLVNTTDSCCDDEESDSDPQPSETNTNMSCCAEQDVLVKIKDHFVKSELNFNAIQLPVLYLNNSFLHESLLVGFIANTNHYNGLTSDPPRKPIPDLGLLYSVFRI